VGESKEHVFVHCPFAKCRWQELGIGVHIYMTSDCELQDWFFNLFYLQDEDLISKVAAALWAIWNQRKGRVWNNVLMPAHRVVKGAIEFLNIWKSSRQNMFQGLIY